jgi:hypothetical protein
MSSKARNHRYALERAEKKGAVPKWVDREALYQVYLKCPKSWTVDHIIPLKGDLVSGLHVPENLQYMPVDDNCNKGNRFAPFVEIYG